MVESATLHTVIIKLLPGLVHGMRNSLYDALEVDSASSTATIQVALRTVVRRFWALPRDASGDSEEAIRFAALAASMLVDPVRRKDYDVALNPGVGMGPWRLPINSRNAAVDGSTQSQSLQGSAGEVSQLSIVAAPPLPLPGVDALAEPLPDGTTWASPLCFVALAAAVLLLLFALSSPFSEWFDLGLGMSLLTTLGVTAVAGLLAAWLSRAREVPAAVASLSRLAIIKWRREASIFIGSPPLQHDTAWIFKLRLMELTRSAAGFVTSASPWRRLAARLVDYALLALVLYALMWFVEWVIPGLDGALALLRSMLVLPTLVVLLAVPASAVLHRVLGTTPGKWLFSLQLISGITRPADHTAPTDRSLLWARAMRVAFSGAAFGFWPVALYRLPGHLRLARDTETDWESKGDSVVMARPLTTPTVATGILILLATTLILLSGWHRDYIVTWPKIVSAYASMRPDVTRTPPLSRLPEPANQADTRDTVATEPTQTNDPSVPASAGTTTSAGVAGAATAAAATAGSVVSDLRSKFGFGAEPKASASTGGGTEATVAAPPTSPAVNSNSPATPPAPQPAASVADNEMAKQAAASQARRVRIEGYARQADAARRSNSYSGLQGACQRWTTDQPGSADAWRCLGLAQFQNGAGRDALPALRQALKIESRDTQVEAAILSILRP